LCSCLDHLNALKRWDLPLRREAEAEDFEFKTSLGYITWATYIEILSPKQSKTKQKKDEICNGLALP
jgi:hypothetical protein